MLTTMEADKADAAAREIERRVMFALKLRGYATDEASVKVVILREVLRGQVQDFLMYHLER